MGICIYLDQSVISAIGRLQYGDHLRKSIIDFFNKMGMTLVMSYEHLLENVSMDSQSIGSRNSFVNDITTKKVIRSYIQISPDEILYAIRDEYIYSPFRDNYFELCNCNPQISDKFGYLIGSEGLKTMRLNEEIDKIDEMIVVDNKKTLAAQGNRPLSRKDYIKKYFERLKDEKHSCLFPPQLKGFEKIDFINCMIHGEVKVPSLETAIRLGAEKNLDYKRSPKKSDIGDHFHLASPLVYCDFIATDRYCVGLVDKASKHKGAIKWGRCVCVATPEDLLDEMSKTFALTKNDR
jgi:hypothetical protein